MEDGSRLPGSRKRHRSDELPSAAFRLSRPSDIVAPKSPRLRAVGNQSNDNDLMPSNPGEGAAPVLQPLHPPIPNFSAISQGAPRPNTVPHSTADPPGGIIYNIALPLPNPGRAHRFCQACDHVNHVRRKLCTNCGAPKPSAVRNAVGVRSISDADLPVERGSHPPDGYGGEGYFPRQVASQSFGPAGGFEIQNRYNTPGFGHGDQRGLRTTDHVVHQARSLAMRCPGDDIPLLGSSQRSVPVQQHSEAHSARRMRGGQTVLGEPLINFSTFQTGDLRGHAVSSRHFGTATDPSDKVFPTHPMDRDQVTLPSMHGMPSQNLGQTPAPNFRSLPRSHNVDPRVMRAAPMRSDKTCDDTLAGDVLPLSQAGTGADAEARRGLRRFQNAQNLRAPQRDALEPQTIYDDIQDGQGNGGLLYRQNQDLFQSQQHYRTEDRDHVAVQSDLLRRQIVAQPLGSATGADIEREFSSPTDHASMHREQRGYNRLVGQTQQEFLRLRMERSRLRHTAEDNRCDPSPLRQSVHSAEQGGPSNLEEQNRQPDDGRFAIENILMQHKNGNPGE